MNRILVIAPHPDDESLGVAGTLLRHKAEGDEIHWLLMTCMTESVGYSAKQIAARKNVIDGVSKAFGFHSRIDLDYPTTSLDQVAKAELIQKLSSVFDSLKPTTIYLPYEGDNHSDHQATFLSVLAATKNFRLPSLKRLLCYETLSETNMSTNPTVAAFRPNVYVGIENFLEEKLKILKLYESEFSEPPFPRSYEGVNAQALLRGSESGFKAAEAFLLLKEIV